MPPVPALVSCSAVLANPGRASSTLMLDIPCSSSRAWAVAEQARDRAQSLGHGHMRGAVDAEKWATVLIVDPIVAGAEPFRVQRLMSPQPQVFEGRPDGDRFFGEDRTLRADRPERSGYLH